MSIFSTSYRWEFEMKKTNKYPHYLPAMLLTALFVIDFSCLYTTHWQWDQGIRNYVSLMQVLNNLEVELSDGHVWIEKHAQGDQGPEVVDQIEQKFALKPILKELSRSDLNFLGDSRDKFAGQLNQISELLGELEHAVVLRMHKDLSQDKDLEAVQFFDHVYLELLSALNRSKVQLQSKLSEELISRDRFFQMLAILFLAVNLVIFYLLYALKKSKEKFEQAMYREKELAEVTLHSIGDGVITTDCNGCVQYMNPVAEHLTGMSLSESKNKSLDEVFHISNVVTGRHISYPVQKIVQRGRIFGLGSQTKLLGPQGKESLISETAAPIRDMQNETIGMVVVFQDETSQTEMRKNLEDTENKYQRLIDSIQHLYFFFSLNPQGQFTYLSDSVEKILGYDKDAFQNHYVEYLTDDPQNQEALDLFNRALKGNVTHPYEMSFFHKDGSVRYVEMVTTPVRDENNKLTVIEGVAKDITHFIHLQQDLQFQRDSLEHEATHDSLTGLSNRALFYDRLKQALLKIELHESEVGVIVLDIDRFKEINDSFGHYYGDMLLKDMASRLRDCLSESDTLSRLGGDEFAMIVENAHGEARLSEIIQNVREAMVEPFLVESERFYLTTSMGITLAPQDSVDPDELIKNADAAMNQAKESGRNTYCFYKEEMTEQALERVTLITNLKQAFMDEQFEMYYQPQMDIASNRLSGMEALVRWNHPERGMILPDKFIYLAEESGMIGEIDQWVMLNVMNQCVRWRERGFEFGRISINLSVKNLTSEGFIDRLKQNLKSTGCDATWLELEITETQLMKQSNEAVKLLKKIKRLGFQVSVDDFGTGYSSLSYLKKLPVDKLKIDRSFISGLPYDDEDVAISKAIIALSHSLRLKVVAEGVEQEMQCNFLREQGCECVQGFFCSHPLSVREVEMKYQAA